VSVLAAGGDALAGRGRCFRASLEANAKPTAHPQAHSSYAEREARPDATRRLSSLSATVWSSSTEVWDSCKLLQRGIFQVVVSCSFQGHGWRIKDQDAQRSLLSMRCDAM